MSLLMDMAKAYFDSVGFYYKEVREDILRIGIGGLENKGNMEIIVIFDDNERTVSLRSFDLCHVPENKRDQMYKICNDINENYRWVKLYIDEDDFTITAQDDAVLQAESAGEEIRELAGHMAQIVDDAYPALMKAVWS